MRTVRRIAELRTELAPARADGGSIGLVPTMGALHDGHLSLLRRSVAATDVTVMSLFVNPTQFNEASDLAAYPRDERRDATLAAELGVDVLFAPDVDEMYPPGFATTVMVADVTTGLEGEHRGREHFDGVATVVCKLLHAVAPDVAYFGQKDAQQAVVIRKLVRDLALPVRIEVCPTVRAPDGLALSSRNVLLSGEDRARAVALPRALEQVRAELVAGEPNPSGPMARAHAELRTAGLEVEYLSVVDPETMAPMTSVSGDALVVAAVRVGAVRLIDNVLIASHPDEHAVATRQRASTGV